MTHRRNIDPAPGRLAPEPSARRPRPLLLAAVAILLIAPAMQGSAEPTTASVPAGAPATATAPASTQAMATEGQVDITLTRAVVLGVVEGLTEYLPVSSTGHLILVSHWMGLSHFTGVEGPLGKRVETAPGVDAYNIVIQLGAILAVLGLYRKRVAQMLAGMVGRDPAGLRLAALLIVAALPAAVVGVLFHTQIKDYLFGPVTVCGALAVGGVLMMLVEYATRRRRKRRETIRELTNIRFWQALVIGCAQILAMWPGTSRSMITIIAALLVGLDMVAAAEFSFLLALPTLGGATLFDLVKDGGEIVDVAGVDGLLVGLVVSGVVAALAVKFFVKWLTHHGLWPFGLYRIAIAAAVWWVLIR